MKMNFRTMYLCSAMAALLLPGYATSKAVKNTTLVGWSVSCAGMLCFAVNQTGYLTFYEKQLRLITGHGQLQTTQNADKAAKMPKPPVSIACEYNPEIANQATCVAADAAGRLWLGPLRATGAPYLLQNINLNDAP